MRVVSIKRSQQAHAWPCAAAAPEDDHADETWCVPLTVLVVPS